MYKATGRAERLLHVFKGTALKAPNETKHSRRLGALGGASAPASGRARSRRLEHDTAPSPHSPIAPSRRVFIPLGALNQERSAKTSARCPKICSVCERGRLRQQPSTDGPTNGDTIRTCKGADSGRGFARRA